MGRLKWVNLNGVGALAGVAVIGSCQLQPVGRIAGRKVFGHDGVSRVRNSKYARAIGWLAIVVAGTMLPLAVMAQTQPGANEREAERQRKLIEEQRRAGESALRAKRQIFKRHIFAGLLDPALERVLGIMFRRLGGH